MDGTALAASVREGVTREVAELGHVGLATVSVGDDPASHVYIAAKHKAATEAGIDARDVRLPPRSMSSSSSRSSTTTRRSNRILVQLPLRPHERDEGDRAASPAKDVDGFHPFNAGNTLSRNPDPRAGDTIRLHGALARLQRSCEQEEAVGDREERDHQPADGDAADARQRHGDGVPFTGRPTSASPPVAPTSSVAAVGRPGIVTADMVKPGATCLDVGLTRTDEGIRGDIDPSVGGVAGFLTPMPGGTEPMTIAMLLQSALKAARRGLLAFPVLDGTVLAAYLSRMALLLGCTCFRRTFVVRDWHRQVVFKREGLQVHRARRRRGRIRPLLGNPYGRLQSLTEGRKGGVRGRPGARGCGGERHGSLGFPDSSFVRRAPEGAGRLDKIGVGMAIDRETVVHVARGSRVSTCARTKSIT